jgi:hypothetical protein
MLILGSRQQQAASFFILSCRHLLFLRESVNTQESYVIRLLESYHTVVTELSGSHQAVRQLSGSCLRS